MLFINHNSYYNRKFIDLLSEYKPFMEVHYVISSLHWHFFSGDHSKLFYCLRSVSHSLSVSDISFINVRVQKI